MVSFIPLLASNAFSPFSVWHWTEKPVLIMRWTVVASDAFGWFRPFRTTLCTHAQRNTYMLITKYYQEKENLLDIPHSLRVGSQWLRVCMFTEWSLNTDDSKLNIMTMLGIWHLAFHLDSSLTNATRKRVKISRFSDRLYARVHAVIAFHAHVALTSI